MDRVEQTFESILPAIDSVRIMVVPRLDTPFPAAAQLANLAAGIEVSWLGADVISREDLSRAFSSRKEAAEPEPAVDMADDRTADEQVLKP